MEETLCINNKVDIQWVSHQTHSEWHKRIYTLAKETDVSETK